MDEFSIHAEFDEVDDAAESPDDATLGELTIRAGADCLTLNRLPRRRLGDPDESVYGTLGGLAEWFIENWAPLLWEYHTPFPKHPNADSRGERPLLPGYGTAFKRVAEPDDRMSEFIPEWLEAYIGAIPEKPAVDDREDDPDTADWLHRHLVGHVFSSLAIPSITALSEDNCVSLSVTALPSSMSPSVDFQGPYGSTRRPSYIVVSKDSFKSSAASFVDGVIANAKSTDKFLGWAGWLADKWAEAKSDESNFGRRLFWMVGPIGAARVEELQLNKDPKADGLRQLLSDSNSADNQLVVDNLESMVEEFAIRSEQIKGSPPSWKTAFKGRISSDVPEFAQGYQLARMARRNLDIKNSKPLGDLAAPLNRLDVSVADAVPTNVFRAAVCAGIDRRAHVVPSSYDIRSQGHPETPRTRFAIASALGRLAWRSRLSESRVICCAQSDQAMISQSRRANAFAAEFLLPREAVQNLREDDDAAFHKVAELYGVSVTAVKWHRHHVANDPPAFWFAK